MALTANEDTAEYVTCVTMNLIPKGDMNLLASGELAYLIYFSD